jgi:hypothetical protein
MANPVYEFLNSAYFSEERSEVISNVSRAYSLLSSSKTPESFIDISVIHMLSKLVSTLIEDLYMPISQFYLEIINFHTYLSNTILVPLCKDALYLSQVLRGAMISLELYNKIKQILSALSTQTLELGEKDIVDSLLQSYIIKDVDARINQSIQDIKHGKTIGITSLIEIFSSFDSIHVQYKVFIDHFDKVLDAIELINNSAIINSLLNLLDLFIYQDTFKIKINETVFLYKIANNALPEDIFKLGVRALQAIVLYEVEISQRAVILIKRLWKKFPQYKEALYDIIKINLSDISAEGSIEYKIKASELLYDVYNSDIDLRYKETLESDKLLKGLFESVNYRPEELSLYNLHDVPVTVGCAMNTEVLATTDHQFYIEAPVDHCVLIWGFVLKYYDISFQIQKVDGSDVLHSEQRVTPDDRPKSGFVLLESRGLYKITWINSYSWFNSKQLRYRVVLLAPVPVSSLPRAQNSVIQSFNYKKVDGEVTGIGVWLTPIIKVYHKGIQENIASILNVYDIVATYPDKSGVSVGIIGAPPIYVPKLDLFNVFTCADSDALALYGLENYNTAVVAVVFEGNVRASVGCAGKVVVSCKEINDAHNEIANFLCLFGPAVLLVAGIQAPDVKTLEKNLLPVVPSTIMQQTFIKQSNTLLMIAASELHAYSLDNNKYR